MFVPPRLLLVPLFFCFQHPFAIQGEELKSLRALLDSIRDVTQYHAAPFTAAELGVLRKMLQWPSEHVLAIMDAVRVLMMHAAANEALGNDALVLQQLFKQTKEGKAKGKDTYQILMLKIVSNWVSKRQRSVGER